MALTIGSNIASLQGQRRLFQTEQRLSTVFERLSSGQRINRASDDAAGLAIASSLNADQRVFNQGRRNLNDGISALNIADSTLAELSEVTVRIRELAQQSANGSLSREQREALDTEAQELRKEFFRVSREAEFNGLKLFDGSLETGIRLQAGYGIDGSIQSSLGGSLANGEFSVGDIWAHTTGTATGIATGDLNQDGFADFIISGAGGVNDLTVFSGSASGSLIRETNLNISGSSGGAIELADFNNDGRLDILSSASSSNISLLLGNCDSTFSSEILLPQSGNLRTADLNTGDFNGDGFADIVAVGDDSVSSGIANIFLGSGTGTFTLSSSFTTSDARSYTVEVADINNDGLDDLAIGTQTSTAGTVAIYTSAGNGSFDSGQTFGSSGTVNEIAFIDVGGDGNLDIAYDGNTPNVSLLSNDGDGNFSSSSNLGGTDGNYNDLIVGDVNGDGLEDLVALGPNAASVYFAEAGSSRLNYDGNLGTGAFSNLTAGVLADFTNDGVLDAASVLSGNLFLLEGDTREGLNPLLDFSLKTQADALQAIGPLERKIADLSKQRGIIGSFQSRVATAIEVLGARSENYAAAESRIRETDVAFESSELTRLNILRQSAASVLAQANQQPALSLALLS